MPAFSDKEYKERELQKDARITRGGALHAASRVATTFGLKTPDEVVAVAEVFETYIKHGAEPSKAVLELREIQEEVTESQAIRNGLEAGESDEGDSTRIEECPECGEGVWDNRPKKQSGKFKANAPDFSCKNKDGCGWAFWPSDGRDGHVVEKPKEKRKSRKPSERAKKVAAKAKGGD